MIEKEQNKLVENLDKLLVISVFKVYFTSVKIMTTGNYSGVKSHTISELKCDSFSNFKKQENNL